MTIEVEQPDWSECADGADRAPRFYLHPGKLLVSAKPTSVTTILGSCVAVCLWDEGREIGGMNHYLLPEGEGEAAGAAAERFAPVALSRLLDQLLELGADQENVKGKLFGGACVLDAFRDSGNDLGSRNVAAARRFLESESVPIVAEDVGGQRGRKLIFHTWNGSVWVRKL